MTGVTINHSQLMAQVSAISSEAARRAAHRVALRARGSILGQQRYQTGFMMSSFHVEDVTVDPKRPTWRVRNSAPYFPFQNQGTGNPPGVGYIYPRRPGGVLAFRGRDGATVFARRVRGVRPGYFMQTAIRLTTLRDYTDPLVTL